MKTVKFKKWTCTIKKARYANAQHPTLTLHDQADGMLIAKATINIPDLPLIDGQVVIKDYAENEGMLDALIKAKIITPPIGYVKTGFTESPICWLLI